MRQSRAHSVAHLVFFPVHHSQVELRLDGSVSVLINSNNGDKELTFSISSRQWWLSDHQQCPKLRRRTLGRTVLCQWRLELEKYHCEVSSIFGKQ